MKIARFAYVAIVSVAVSMPLTLISYYLTVGYVTPAKIGLLGGYLAKYLANRINTDIATAVFLISSICWNAIVICIIGIPLLKLLHYIEKEK